MRSYITISANARDRAPFSNSTEGAAWTANWCDKCTHDTGAPDDGCPILLVGLMGKTPTEWQPGDRLLLGATYRCAEFRLRRDEPPAQVPGQLALFIAEEGSE
ncbi:hypothetical protein ACXJJ3_08835 [Kribbella sp. WER1]